MQHLFRHLATYNQWMNRKLYNAAAVLSDEQLTQDRGAFFGSIWATLNHIAVGDILWLRRVANGFPHLAALAPVQDLPQPTALTDILCPDVAALTQLRATIDEVLTHVCTELSEQDLNTPLEYHSTKRHQKQQAAEPGAVACVQSPNAPSRPNHHAVFANGD